MEEVSAWMCHWHDKMQQMVVQLGKPFWVGIRVKSPTILKNVGGPHWRIQRSKSGSPEQIQDLRSHLKKGAKEAANYNTNRILQALKGKERVSRMHISSKLLAMCGACLCCLNKVLNERKKPRMQSTVNSFLSDTDLNYWTLQSINDMDTSWLSQ
jgi:hypothetical protein